MARKKITNVAAQKPFTILKLPPEIRNRIWKFTVVSDQPIRVCNHKREDLAKRLPPSTLRSGKEMEYHHKDDLRRITSVLAIAFTCRQVYLEVTPIYYSKNTFIISDFWYGCWRRGRIADFAVAIGATKAESITFAIAGSNSDSFESILHCFPNLMQLDLGGTFFSYALSRSYISSLKSLAKTKPDLVLTAGGKPLGRYL